MCLVKPATSIRVPASRAQLRRTDLLPLLHVLDERAHHEPKGRADRGEQGEEGEEEEVPGGVEAFPEHAGGGRVADEEEDGRGQEDGVEGLRERGWVIEPNQSDRRREMRGRLRIEWNGTGEIRETYVEDDGVEERGQVEGGERVGAVLVLAEEERL